MPNAQSPWKLTDSEWRVLSPLLEPAERTGPVRGRPRIEGVRSIAEACLFRSFRSRSTGRSHSFNWNALPPEFGISGSTANRRFREWNASGAWAEFWAALLKLRGPGKRLRPRRTRKSSPFPVSDLLAELERAYHFLNDVLFGGELPHEVAITVISGHGRGDRLGYFCGRAWRWGREEPVDLIAISALGVGRGADVALETLIHEMVHHRNDRHKLVDCTNRGYYHNLFFRDAAILAGLVCAERHGTLGFGVTALGDRARWAISRLHPKLDIFGTAKPAGRLSP